MFIQSFQLTPKIVRVHAGRTITTVLVVRKNQTQLAQTAIPPVKIYQLFSSTNINNVKLHFVHVRSTKANAMPFLLLHGWPDSFYRFQKLIPLLSEFHLVIPSLPGFGFSQLTPKTPTETGDLLAQLMAGLGYEKYLVHGGDVGAERRSIFKSSGDKTLDTWFCAR